MGDKEDYLTTYRVFFENFAATVNPEDQLPVNIAGYTITESELPGEVLYWTTQYLSEKQCPSALLTPLLRIILDEVRVASKKQPAEFGYKADESVYVALRLMQAVTARVNDVCLRYLDNSRLDSLPPPPAPHLQELRTVSAATKNSRRVMEDRHVEIGNLEALFGIECAKPTAFYAVYDGHAGSAAATYCAAHLHQYLVESPHYSTDLRKALRDAFLRTDNDFIRKSNQERACGGSTAVVVVVRGCQLHAAWAGDSLALLAKRMRLMQLVRPHKPSRQDEKDRIQAGGGAVMFWGTWRVNGQLAVSRAIGDAMYKPYVTARPELATVDLDGDEDFVVVACDGLWDFVSEDEVALAVYRQLAADPDDLKAVTKRLIVQAKRQGSCDNISIIVVFLKDPRDIAADNRPPMDLGLDNALVNASLPPFAVDADAKHHGMDGAAADCEPEGELPDNGVDNSDSDSEDLGPETAVDADDLDAEARNHVAAPTPPAHTGGTADEKFKILWNYYKTIQNSPELSATKLTDMVLTDIMQSSDRSIGTETTENNSSESKIEKNFEPNITPRAITKLAATLSKTEPKIIISQIQPSKSPCISFPTSASSNENTEDKKQPQYIEIKEISSKQKTESTHLDKTDHLFLSYADTFKQFTPRRQAVLKLELARIFVCAELTNLDHAKKCTCATSELSSEGFNKNILLNHLEPKPFKKYDATRELDKLDYLFLIYADTFKGFGLKGQAIIKLELTKLFTCAKLAKDDLEFLDICGQ
ncbi:protein phosphatase 1E-like isoform X1 [Leguminivora glycinivorella]|uniref:protein phosphatase 1E-like isoform X1 n=1 Tax=Leguminivora glycinivorella TaxID=1035111 RepID=UPI00200BB010|nr:protein phosphatase 1E-like isoform X1 [Leguminivora glycinivorella]